MKDNNQSPGAPVVIWGCNGGANQQWELTAKGELRVFGGTRCLDAFQGRTAAGTPVISYTCNGQTNQQWRQMSDGSIRGLQSGLCLDVAGASTRAGTPLQIAACADKGSQRWSAAAPTDTVSPTVPRYLSVSGMACRSLTLSWAASSDNVGVAFYDVYHDGQLMVSVNGSTLRTVLNVTPGVTWGLYVNARDAAGNVSQASATLSVAVPPCAVDGTAPSVPTGLRGTVAGTTATLTWVASTDNVAVTAYDIYRNEQKVGSSPNLRFVDSGLAPRTTYRYAITARDGQGNSSARSATLSVSTGGSCSNAVCSVEQVATETDVPWGLIALPDGTVIYSRRDAHDLIRLDPATGTKTNLGTVPNAVSTDGEGGLLGLAVTTAFPGSDTWIYVYYTTPTDNRIVRIRYLNGRLDSSTLQVLLAGIGRNKYHNGGRLRFGPDGKLYASTGDAQNGSYAQNVSNLNGKILRINSDGTVPADNPFGNAVWSYGHRNPQGLAFDSQGRLWQQEFGNSTQDETNLIVKGGNYGWPACEGTVSQSAGGCSTPGFIAPAYTYTTANGSCSGIAIVRDVLYVACLRGNRLYREVISGNSLTNVQELFMGTYGRLRTVEPTRDGGLWLTTTNTGDKDSIPNNSNEKILKVILGD
ncbi:PQQ-dependent sugar dehydrogenase [Xylophilus sp. GOD-11R]|uniref:PQQ-dependent sugar dehydrogenase n=1 Tax=Xylophilus sp. GOD-11R TaxID=3089814 RepID=UPI00298D45F2|nr:PQQ-dependent sugar dehydrogenase [Xylophilus sp. GOD-11R]WPB58943.1 PQQ-dependent sugar dehydrogenase [Xylophilus sp. GOD-11R]